MTPVLADATSSAAGGVSVGGTTATANSLGRTNSALLGSVLQATSADVSAAREVSAVAMSEAPAVGVLAGIAGANSVTNVAPDIRAIVNGDVTASGNILISADSKSRAASTASGSGGGFLGFGDSTVTAHLKPTVTSQILIGSNVNSTDGNVRLVARHNILPDGMTAPNTGATATGTASGNGFAGKSTVRRTRRPFARKLKPSQRSCRRMTSASKHAVMRRQPQPAQVRVAARERAHT